MTTEARQATQKPRIALYGGAFDPVHRAHLEVARAAQKQAGLDEVIFIPSARSPLKAHGPVGGDARRFEMLQLALAGEPRFSVDDRELKRGGVSYTLDTVRSFTEHQPEADFFWIIGGDQLAQLDRWRAIEDLVCSVVFLVLARPGYHLAPPAINGLRWRKVDAPLMRESSTQIRERIAKGRSVAGLLPESVEAFIRTKGLYK